MYEYLFETLLSIILGIYPEVELLDHVVVLFLIFWGTSILFSTAVAPFYIPTDTAQGELNLIQQNCTAHILYEGIWARPDGGQRDGEDTAFTLKSMQIYLTSYIN